MSSTLLHCVSITNLARNLSTPPKLKRKKLCVTAASAADPSDYRSPSHSRNPLSLLINAPRSIWRETLKPLNNFGFGRKAVLEGGAGQFVVSGIVLFVLSLAWLRTFNLQSKFRKYSAVFEFDHACGIGIGTPVRIRGIGVGSVVRVHPSLRSIEAVAEIEDDRLVIPRNSLVEVNQSGLLMGSFIDITPGNRIPKPTNGPLDAGCKEEGLIVCDREKMQGRRGVSFDELVGIMTRLGREVEAIDASKSYSLSDHAAAVIEEAYPLLRKVESMVDDAEPLLAELRNRGLLKKVETLTKTLARASDDLRVHSSILAPENTELIQNSIHALVLTLKNIENISTDISGLTGDKTLKENLKLLIKSLNRLLM
ncbi:protein TRIGALACTOSYLDIACYLGLYCEROL 2, chloroplastic-like isoform X2 [Andrographis paniculata]|uniref:protein TRIGALACTOSYLDIACYLGLYCEROL 2, chloroplastic-like isoform X2 n=1 Tax=Andrographis paniculata TaxID=175694 RepID=UPI0021E8A3D7|nr:protein TRIGALACTOSYLDIACYLGLYCEROL 2, chloroplastic-like isoform X2 [Andrographis paniculata]